MNPSEDIGEVHKPVSPWREAGELLLVLSLALWMHCLGLGVRPMHADEANQAVKLGRLLDEGIYKFDPQDHHGPTLYYFGLIPAWLRGQTSLAALDEVTVRLTPTIAGVLAAALLWRLVRPWGRGPAQWAVGFLVFSPAAVYYSRYFIQETLLVLFTLGALVCGQRWWRAGGMGWAIGMGVCLGLMLATKASAVVYAAVALVSLAASGASRRPLKQLCLAAGVALMVALAVAALFYSSFGRNLAGLRDAAQSIGFMSTRATAGVSGHEKPWWYYGSLFVWQRNGGYLWDQTLFVLPALAGGALALRQRGLPRFVAMYTMLIAVIFSATPYKTPWLVVGMIPGMCALAAFAFSKLSRPLAQLSVVVVVLALAWQMRQAIYRLPADERNPFAYVHAVPDMKKVPALAAAAPAGPVKVISSEYWPLPWYLRQRAETGYWTEPPADCDGALVFADAGQADVVRARLKGNYREGFIGLRPGFVLVVFQRE